jgi:hypothetical protein
MCNVKKIKIIIDESIQIINLIKSKKENHNQLINLQLQDEISESLKLIRPIEIKMDIIN